MATRTVRLIVLNYNARDLLEKYLPDVLAAARSSRHICRVTLLDNASIDGSVEWVRDNLPEAEVWSAPQNRVLCSYNDYLRSIGDEIVILLNNDIRPDKDFVDPLIEPFVSDPDTFFAATYEDRALPSWRWGVLSADESGAKNGFYELEGLAFSAGIAAFDRKKFMELDGYDDLYLPGRYEDLDLCYRAWRRGWKGYYVPKSRKYHEGGTSFNKAFGWEKTQSMVYRNSVLFMIKNISDPMYLLRFALLLPLRLGAALVQRKWFIWRGFLSVWPRLGLALQKRSQVLRNTMLSDRQVVRIFRPNE
jgi:GT2 family glycosyltransferase